jgi:hypothetical protein
LTAAAIIPEVNLSTKNAAKITQKDDVISVIAENRWTSYPIYCKEALNNGESFKVEVVDAACKWFTIGLASSGLSQTTDRQESELNLSLHGNSWIYSNGRSRRIDLDLTNGDVITVTLINRKVEWKLNGNDLASAPVPKVLEN